MSFVTPLSLSVAPANHGLLQPFEFDEPIPVWFGRYLDDDELSRTCRQLLKLRNAGGALTVVICRHADDAELNLGALLDQVGTADRVVLTAAKASTAAQWPIQWGDLRAEADKRRMKSVQIETAVDRAVIGAMQSLQAGDTFAVLVSADIETDRVTGWLIQGARWRGSLEAQDEDVFHHLAE